MAPRMTLGLALQALHERGITPAQITLLPGENGTIYHAQTSAGQAINVHPDGTLERRPTQVPPQEPD